jgi:hypothetical protein
MGTFLATLPLAVRIITWMRWTFLGGSADEVGAKLFCVAREGPQSPRIQFFRCRCAFACPPNRAQLDEVNL